MISIGNYAFAKIMCLNTKHHTISNQPMNKPKKVTTIAAMRLIGFFVLRNEDHLTKISVIQLTTGMRRRIIWMIRDCLLNHVAIIIVFSFFIVYFIIKF